MTANDPPPYNDRFGEIIAPLRAEFDVLNGSIASLNQENKTLKNDLDLYKNAYEYTNAKLTDARKGKEEAEKERDEASLRAARAEEELEKAVVHGDIHQMKGHRVTVLLDGDGAIFNDGYILEGQAGGHRAAQRLQASIVRHLNVTLGDAAYQIWVHIFFNKRGLADTLSRMGIVGAKELDEFVLGFNQSTERFTMLDVGNTKEAADAKLRVLLEDETRLSNTVRVYFAGCHDNGYANTLRTLITEGFRDKLVLLRGYSDMASEINKLNLHDYTIPDLFRTSKIVNSPRFASRQATNTPHVISSPGSSTNISQSDFGFKPDGTPVSGASQHAVQSPQTGLRRLLAETQSRQSSDRQRPVSDPPPGLANLGTRPFSASSPATQAKSSGRQPLKLDPNKYVASSILVPLLSLARPLADNPRPCLSFYLLDYCAHDEDCTFSHDYEISHEDWTRMQKDAKNIPCKWNPCNWGDDCIYGHACPKGRACEFYKNGRCKFGGGAR
ncbi:hypothetical protein EV121DRAFT_254242 [Schizophyllum commune]